MRHGKKNKKLGRKSEHRESMLANLVCDLIRHGRIRTTVAKAKVVRPFAEKMVTLGKRAHDGKLSLDELSGGTFTITNGGIYGSLMSTPILNAPQSGILGMHKIQERPVAIGGKVEIRPMMYLAVSYDHRVIDGKEAVTFLVRVKENLEDPARMVLDL